MVDTTTKVSVSFERQMNGYDKEQVDRYISELSEAYQEAYDEYQYICEKYNEALEQKRAAEESGASDLIQKTLINAEILAEQLIKDAKTESDKIKTEAVLLKSKVNQELETIQNAKSVLISDINNIVKKLEITGVMPKENGNKIRIKRNYHGSGILYKPNGQ